MCRRDRSRYRHNVSSNGRGVESRKGPEVHPHTRPRKKLGPLEAPSLRSINDGAMQKDWQVLGYILQGSLCIVHKLVVFGLGLADGTLDTATC